MAASDRTYAFYHEPTNRYILMDWCDELLGDEGKLAGWTYKGFDMLTQEEQDAFQELGSKLFELWSDSLETDDELFDEDIKLIVDGLPPQFSVFDVHEKLKTVDPTKTTANIVTELAFMVNQKYLEQKHDPNLLSKLIGEEYMYDTTGFEFIAMGSRYTVKENQ